MLNKKVVFRAPKHVALEEEDIPSPSSSQILIRTLVTLISTGTELTMLSGEFPKGSIWDIMKYPGTPGYSNCGVVEEIGEDVAGVQVGDTVLSFAGHAKYVLVKANRILAKVPDGILEEEATFGTLAGTAMNGVRLADISLGECVVVVGVGIVGQLACQFSRLCGGFPVVAVDLSQKRLEIVKKLGATVTLNPTKHKVADEVLSLTKGRGADVVFEVTGSPTVVPWALNLVKPMIRKWPPEGRPVLGRYVQLSSPRGPSTIDFHDQVNFPSRIIIGAHETSHPEFETPYNPWTRRRNIALFFDLLKAGKVNVKELITNRYPVTEAEAVYEMLLEPTGDRLQCIGVLFDFRE